MMNMQKPNNDLNYNNPDNNLLQPQLQVFAGNSLQGFSCNAQKVFNRHFEPSKQASVVNYDQSYQQFRGLGGNSISMQSVDNVSLLVQRIFGNNPAAATNLLEKRDKGSMRNGSLNGQAIGGAASVSNGNLTQDDLMSLKGMLGIGKQINKQINQIGAGGSVIGNSSLIWPMQSMRQSLLSLN